MKRILVAREGGGGSHFGVWKLKKSEPWKRLTEPFGMMVAFAEHILILSCSYVHINLSTSNTIYSRVEISLI